MFEKLNEFCAKLLVDYQAVSELVTGFLCLIYTIFILGTTDSDATDNQVIRKTFYYFLIGFSITTVIKSFLLLYGIQGSHRKCTLIYLILSIVVLFVAKIFVIIEGIQMNQTVNEIEEITQLDKSYKKLLRRNFRFMYYIFFPLVFVFNWFVQLYVYLFYRSLRRDSSAQTREEEAPLSAEQQA